MRLVEADAAREDTGLPVLLRVVTHLTTTYPGFVGEGAEKRFAAFEQEVLDVIGNSQRPGSLQFTLTGLALAARSVRDRLSDDSWRAINGLSQVFVEHPLQLSVALNGVEQLIFRLAAFTGLTTERMSRGYGWHFLDMGRRLERALFGSGLLRVACVSTEESGNALWEALLAITDNLVTYRRRYRSSPQEAPMLDLLLLDEAAPRSVAYQLARLQEHVAALPKKTGLSHRSAEERAVLEALTLLRLADLEPLLLVPEGKEEREALDRLLSRLGYLLHSLSDAITLSYFRQSDLPQQLVDIQ
jgi:uncharacterized alpha-E superfamily protein